eukprot:SAG11_NODE_832_length_6948_cov_10.083662_7_plen_533_part_00
MDENKDKRWYICEDAATNVYLGEIEMEENIASSRLTKKLVAEIPRSSEEGGLTIEPSEEGDLKVDIKDGSTESDNSKLLQDEVCLKYDLCLLNKLSWIKSRYGGCRHPAKLKEEDTFQIQLYPARRIKRREDDESVEIEYRKDSDLWDSLICFEVASAAGPEPEPEPELEPKAEPKECNPHRAESLMYYAKKLQDTKRLLGAKQMLEKAKRLDPGNHIIHRAWDDVRESLRERAERDRTHQKLWNYLHSCLQADPGNRSRIPHEDNRPRIPYEVDTSSSLHGTWEWREGEHVWSLQRRVCEPHEPRSIPLPRWRNLFTDAMGQAVATAETAEDVGSPMISMDLVAHSTLRVMVQELRHPNAERAESSAEAAFDAVASRSGGEARFGSAEFEEVVRKLRGERLTRKEREQVDERFKTSNAREGTQPVVASKAQFQSWWRQQRFKRSAMTIELSLMVGDLVPFVRRVLCCQFVDKHTKSHTARPSRCTHCVQRHVSPTRWLLLPAGELPGIPIGAHTEPVRCGREPSHNFSERF